MHGSKLHVLHIRLQKSMDRNDSFSHDSIEKERQEM